MKIALEFINILNNAGYESYIVGGFVRDYLLGINSSDIDITTSATPKEIKEIFSNLNLKKSIEEDNVYGSIVVNYKNKKIEVTTMREESDYLDNRHPSSIKYVKDLKIDLKRRDFTINTICMNKNGQIVDYYNGVSDLKNKIIKTIIDSNKSFQTDALRILRAIRFMVLLNFNLDDNLKQSIKKQKDLLKSISYQRKKRELDKIFTSSNAKYGINVIKELNLDHILELTNLDKIKDYSDVLGIWSMINSSKYPFNKHEKEVIKKVNQVYKLDNLDPYNLYKYGLYVNILAGCQKGLSKRKIVDAYNNILIHEKKDIKITSDLICKVLNKEAGSFLKDIYSLLEHKILNNELNNNQEDIINYLKKIKI